MKKLSDLINNWVQERKVAEQEIRTKAALIIQRYPDRTIKEAMVRARKEYEIEQKVKKEKKIKEDFVAEYLPIKKDEKCGPSL